MEVLDSRVIDGIEVRTGLVDSDAEQVQVEQLRWATYVEERGDIRTADIKKRYRRAGRERDDHDGSAIHLIQTIQFPGGPVEAVGTIRFMRCDRSYDLARETFDGWRFSFPFSHPETGEPFHPRETAEASRWINRRRRLITPEGRSVRLSDLTFRSGLEPLRREGRRWWINGLLEYKFQELVARGWEFVQIGPTASHERTDAKLVPCVLRVPDRPEDDYPIDLFR